MNDRPEAGELIDAVRHFLEKELLPTVSDQRLKFQSLVALNVLAIARRELTTEPVHLREEAAVLARLLGEEAPAADLSAVRAQNARLVARIEAGDFDAPTARQELLAVLRQQVVRKLEVTRG
jgi:hypothetical protein